MPARDRAHRRWKRPTRSFASPLRRRVFGRGRRPCADDVSYFTIGAVSEEQAGERGGTVEQAPLAAVAGRDRRLRQAGPDGVEQETRGDCRWIGEKETVVRNVEGPKGDD